MKIKAARCNKCNVIIYSRARHDYIRCTCGSIAVDGGQTDYVRILGNPDDFELKTIELNVTIEELLDDYTSGRNELGKLSIRN